jgi:hypothetical protein
MFTQYLFALVPRLIFSRLARNFVDHHGACESAYSAWVGPLRLEVNQCHVLDHEDVVIGSHIPTLWGRLEFTFMACRGEEQIRERGVQCHWWPRVVTNHNRPKQTAVLEEEFPF